MTDEHGIAFQKFLINRKKDLQRIAWRTEREYELADVQAEAWLMADYILKTRKVRIDFSDPQHQDMLISYLYQHFVRYTDLRFRHSDRLDHWDDSEDGSPRLHPILRGLAAPAGSDPAAEAQDADPVSAADETLSYRESLAGAYVKLLRHFDNRMLAVAGHLLISKSYCYARYAMAKRLAELQQPFPDPRIDVDEDFFPRPWRPFRIWTPPQQLDLDFGDESALFSEH